MRDFYGTLKTHWTKKKTKKNNDFILQIKYYFHSIYDQINDFNGQIKLVSVKLYKRA